MGSIGSRVGSRGTVYIYVPFFRFRIPDVEEMTNSINIWKENFEIPDSRFQSDGRFQEKLVVLIRADVVEKDK